MTIPPRFKDELRNRLTLSEIIGRRISIKRAGREFKACCPFHNEKTPSFTINDDKQFYHCFGCGAHGDVIGFVMQHDNLDFMSAMEVLSAEAGMQMPKPDPQAAEKAERAKTLHDVMDVATGLMQEQLENATNQDVMNYLIERGIPKETQAGFRIGYAPADGQSLRKALNAKGFHDSQMLEVGLLKESTKGGDPYVFFRDRVMFPVTDRRGRVVAFGGRILPEHIRPQSGDFKPPKYINTSDTPLFDKGRMLYGESHARQAAREGHSIVVTEGYMDVIAAHQAGFRGAVAPMGTALTENQILSLWQMIPDEEKTPVLCFDGDNAGRSAAARACERILPLLVANQSVKFAFLPDGEDPDSILRTGGAKAFRSVLQAAIPLFDFLWASHTAGRDFSTPEKRAGLEKLLHNEVSKIKDQNVQRFYREVLKSKISETFFQRRSGGLRAASQRGQKPQMGLKPRRPTARNTDVKDRILLATMINYPYIYNQIEEAFGMFVPQNARLNAVRQSIVMLCGDDEALDSLSLKTHLSEQGYAKEMDDILCESVYVHASFCRPSPKDDQEDENLAQEWLRFWEREYRITGQDEHDKSNTYAQK